MRKLLLPTSATGVTVPNTSFLRLFRDDPKFVAAYGCSREVFVGPYHPAQDRLSDEAAEDIIDRILAFLSPKEEAASADFPYLLRDDFLSAAELSYHRVLQGVLNGRLVVCPKVALGDLFFAQTGDHRQNRVALNRIDRKHVDFLLCDPTTMRPRVGIELDDRSHERQDRKERDTFVHGVFTAAKLPLVRVPAKHGYSATEVEGVLRPHFGIALQEVVSTPVTPKPSIQTGGQGAPAPGQTEAQAPLCPKCGAAMILRTARAGANHGGRFWGCRNFPRCRSVVTYGESPC